MRPTRKVCSNHYHERSSRWVCVYSSVFESFGERCQIGYEWKLPSVVNFAAARKTARNNRSQCRTSEARCSIVTRCGSSEIRNGWIEIQCLAMRSQWPTITRDLQWICQINGQIDRYDGGASFIAHFTPLFAEETIKSETSGDVQKGLLAIVRSVRSRPHFFAEQLRKAMKVCFWPSLYLQLTYSILLIRARVPKNRRWIAWSSRVRKWIWFKSNKHSAIYTAEN